MRRLLSLTLTTLICCLISFVCLLPSNAANAASSDTQVYKDTQDPIDMSGMIEGFAVAGTGRVYIVLGSGEIFTSRPPHFIWQALPDVLQDPMRSSTLSIFTDPMKNHDEVYARNMDSHVWRYLKKQGQWVRVPWLEEMGPGVTFVGGNNILYAVNGRFAAIYVRRPGETGPPKRVETCIQKKQKIEISRLSVNPTISAEALGLSRDFPKPKLILTRDYGTSWTELHLPKTLLDFGALKDAGITIFGMIPGQKRTLLVEVTNEYGTGALLASMNWGRSWKSIPLPIGTPLFNSANIVVSPTTPPTLYFPYNGTLIISQNCGKTWYGDGVEYKRDNILPFNSINQIVVDPTNAKRVYTAASRILRMTQDCGKTWRTIPLPKSKE